MNRINLLSNVCRSWPRELNNTICIPFPTKLANYICRNKKWSFTIITGSVTVISIIAIHVIKNSKSSAPKYTPIPPPEIVPPVVKNSESTFISDIEAWKNNGAQSENRIKTAEQMLFCMNFKYTTLYLVNLNLSSLPPGIQELTHLTDLSLESNQLTVLPDSFGTLSSLTELNLYRSRLTALPESFCNLSSLKNLDLYFNRLTALPSSFGNLSSLKKLDLSHNQLTVLLDSFCDLSSLASLILYGNQLTSLPSSFSNLSSLTELCLNENQLTALPHSFGNLSSLKKLYLNENQLTALPNSFDNLSSLKKLSLSGNQLTALPDAIEKFVNLKEFDLSRNQLTALPNSFGNLSSLKELNLGENQLTVLPKSFGNLSSLNELDLYCNRLTVLPNSFGNLSSLKKLYLNENQLTALPNSFDNLSSLKELSLSGNQLTALPDAIEKFVNLKELDLSRNQLTSIPNTILELPSACIVFLEINPLSQIELQRLQTAINAPDYSGPRIQYSIYETPKNLKSTKIILTEFFEKAKQDFFIVPQSISENVNFHSWLNKLSFTADYQCDRAAAKQLATMTLKYIQLAKENKEFRNTFLTIISDAHNIRGVRAALSLLDLGVAYRLHTISLENPQAVAKYIINTCWALDELKLIANNKVLTLKFVDETEVYFTYLIKIHESLEMDLGVQKVLYFSCSAVSDDDLANAKKYVLSLRNYNDEKMYYLINHPKWIEVLTHHKMNEMKALDNLYDEYYMSKAVRKIREGKLALTQSLLNNS